MTINIFDMKQLAYILFALSIAGALTITSCSKMDEYLKYTGGKEIIYTGKVDSMIFRSGRERIVFTGLLISDPNINKVSIYWANKTDSLILPIERSGGVDSLWVEIPLPEGAYNFQVFTSDVLGNSSVVTDLTGNSYGARYQRGLYDRPTKSAIQYPAYQVDDPSVPPFPATVIEWYNADPTSFVLVTFTDDNDVEHTRIVPDTRDTTILAHMKPLSMVRVQTMFRPDEFAVDTFAVDPYYLPYQTQDVDITTLYIKNSGAGDVGIRGTVVSGEFGDPLDWTVSDNLRLNAGTNQHGWSSRNGQILAFETNPTFQNGKIYQSFTLPAGRYEVSHRPPGNQDNASAWAGGWNDTWIDASFMAAKGTELPNLEDLETSENVLGHVRGGVNFWKDNGSNNWKAIQFELTEETEICIGIVATLKNDAQMRIKEFKLVSKGWLVEP